MIEWKYMNDDKMMKAMQEFGFKTTVDNDGNVTMEPSVLRFKSIQVENVTRGRYITDPHLVPDELKDKNILWVEEPMVVSAVTLSGEEIPVYVEEVIMNKRRIYPDEQD